MSPRQLKGPPHCGGSCRLRTAGPGSPGGGEKEASPSRAHQSPALALEFSFKGKKNLQKQILEIVSESLAQLVGLGHLRKLADEHLLVTKTENGGTELC